MVTVLRVQGGDYTVGPGWGHHVRLGKEYKDPVSGQVWYAFGNSMYLACLIAKYLTGHGESCTSQGQVCNLPQDPHHTSMGSSPTVPGPSLYVDGLLPPGTLPCGQASSTPKSTSSGIPRLSVIRLWFH